MNATKHYKFECKCCDFKTNSKQKFKDHIPEHKVREFSENNLARKDLLLEIV